MPQTPIQFGGGVRSLADVETALDLGATRVILGTVAVQNPDLVEEMIGRFGPERIVIGIDARDGQVATHGWLRTSDTTAIALGQAMRSKGVSRIVYTDIARDGMLTGVNVEATAALARATGLQVIASGGVASLEDIVRLGASRASRQWLDGPDRRGHHRPGPLHRGGVTAGRDPHGAQPHGKLIFQPAGFSKGAAALRKPPGQLSLDVGPGEIAGSQQDQRVVGQVRQLADQPLVALALGRDDDLDGFFAHLL